MENQLLFEGNKQQTNQKEVKKCQKPTQEKILNYTTLMNFSKYSYYISSLLLYIIVSISYPQQKQQFNVEQLEHNLHIDYYDIDHGIFLLKYITLAILTFFINRSLNLKKHNGLLVCAILSFLCWSLFIYEFSVIYIQAISQHVGFFILGIVLYAVGEFTELCTMISTIVLYRMIKKSKGHNLQQSEKNAKGSYIGLQNQLNVNSELTIFHQEEIKIDSKDQVCLKSQINEYNLFLNNSQTLPIQSSSPKKPENKFKEILRRVKEKSFGKQGQQQQEKNMSFDDFNNEKKNDVQSVDMQSITTNGEELI